MPPWLQVILLAALPVTELRAALPIAITVFHFSPLEALLLSAFGCFLPVPVIYYLLNPALHFVRARSAAFDKFVEQYFHTLKHRYQERFERWGAFALAVFVAIPLPGFGAWSGALLAVLFGIRAGYALPAMAVGVVVQGLIVLAVTTGSIALIT